MTSPGAGEALVVRRFLAVARERVFAAWLDPASLARWMLPDSVISAEVEVDPRVGGRFRIAMHRRDEVVEHRGEYLVIDPPARLEFTWISIHTDRRPSVVTVELHERDGGTDLVLTHRRLPEAEVEAHRKGWTDIVRKLEEILAS